MNAYVCFIMWSTTESLATCSRGVLSEAVVVSGRKSSRGRFVPVSDCCPLCFHRIRRSCRDYKFTKFVNYEAKKEGFLFSRMASTNPQMSPGMSLVTHGLVHLGNPISQRTGSCFAVIKFFLSFAECSRRVLRTGSSPCTWVKETSSIT